MSGLKRRQMLYNLYNVKCSQVQHLFNAGVGRLLRFGASADRHLLPEWPVVERVHDAYLSPTPADLTAIANEASSSHVDYRDATPANISPTESVRDRPA